MTRSTPRNPDTRDPGSLRAGPANAITDWLDPARCPAGRPPVAAMSEATRTLHDGIDDHARRTGVPYLHPDEPTVQLDLLGSAKVVEWQEAKAAFLFASEG